jgi:ABC-2 type transport system ATP-binding protein
MSLVELRDVTKSFGSVRAVEGASFQIGRGEVVGFLGPNGAGKTTTMRLITQVLEPDSGQVSIGGSPIDSDPIEARRRIGYLPETNPLYSDMLVSEYLDYAGELRQLDRPTRARRIGDVVAETGLESVFYRPVNQLSKGFRQRTGLAQAILSEPDILILDEPTEGLDPNQRVEIRKLITRLGEERTVLLSTHVMQEVQLTCGRLLIMHQGRIIADGAVDTLLSGEARGGLRVVAEIEGDAGAVRSGLEGLESVGAVEVLEQRQGRNQIAIVGAGSFDPRPDVFRLAGERGWVLWELRREHESLEDFFRDLTEAAS